MSSAPNLLKKTRGALARRLSPKWRVILSLPFLLLVPITRAGEPVSPTRELQKLIPADASVVLTVEDLRGQVRELLASRLASDFLNLPAVKNWFDSEKYEQLETARDQIEGMLQAKLTEIRDQVLGDAVVIALRLPPDRPFDPGKAQGILVLKAGNPALLKRLIDLINTIQKQNGELATVVERVRGDVSYFVREFPAGSDRRAEAYVTFPDGTFAISNFGELITDLIDRKTAKHDAGSHGPASLADLPRFQSLDHKLPGRALARLYIDSRLAESLHKDSPQPKSPPEALIRRYVAALEAAGAALVVADQNIEINTAEVFEPHKFDGLFGSANVQSPSTPPRLDHVPATALAVGSLEVDFAALYRVLVQFVPEGEQARRASIETVLKGLLLGMDLQSQILPRLGPHILAFVDAPAGWKPGHRDEAAVSRNWPFPIVLAVEMRADTQPTSPLPKTPRQPTVADALDNALNTALAVVTLNGKFAEAHSSVVTHEVAGVCVKTLDPPIPFAYAMDPSSHRLLLGNSAAAVDRFLSSGSKLSAGARFSQLQASAFPKADSFLCLDLAAVETMITTHHDRIIEMLASRKPRPRDEVARDLDQFVALSPLFDAASLTHRVEGDRACIYHTLGLLTRQKATHGGALPKP